MVEIIRSTSASLMDLNDCAHRLHIQEVANHLLPHFLPITAVMRLLAELQLHEWPIFETNQIDRCGKARSMRCRSPKMGRCMGPGGSFKELLLRLSVRTRRKKIRGEKSQMEE
ncbi:hypothetical protein ACLOJK_009251 [Asimina triloba]